MHFSEWLTCCTVSHSFHSSSYNQPRSNGNWAWQHTPAWIPLLSIQPQHRTAAWFGKIVNPNDNRRRPHWSSTVGSCKQCLGRVQERTFEYGLAIRFQYPFPAPLWQCQESKIIWFFQCFLRKVSLRLEQRRLKIMYCVSPALEKFAFQLQQ